MPNALQQAGALSEPTNFAPLHTNRIFTGLWTNRSLMRDAATTDYQEAYGMGRQDSILGGYNSEISSRLTLRRRPGSGLYNSQVFPPIKRFYSFNTFTLTDEVIRVLADGPQAVYDITGPNTYKVIWTKTQGAGSTYFLGVGNTLYFTNGIENVQWNYETDAVTKWGIDGPTTAPTASQAPKPNPYGSWRAGAVFSPTGTGSFTIEELVNTALQQVTTFGVTGVAEPTWTTNPTPDGTVVWTRVAGDSGWDSGHNYAVGVPVIGRVLDPRTGFMVGNIFWCVTAGISGALEPNWVPGIGTLTGDGPVVWKNGGNVLTWSDVGTGTTILGTPTIVDPNGYLQTIVQPGKTGNTPPTLWALLRGAYTYDGTAVWQNMGPFSVATTAPVQYGYAAAITNPAGIPVDISNMSPPSIPIVVTSGSQVTVQGVGTKDGDTLILYSTAQGGSTFMQLATIPNPGAGVPWTYIDPNPGYGQNFELQAQRGGEGTPLPAGATCLGYHLGRIFAAVGNVVWVSSGPDATVAGSSGNAGFDVQLVAQSKIIRFWACSLGMVVFTVRDAYIILGSATDTDPLYMVVFIENLPLRSYDCFTVNKTTPYLLMGNNQLVALDPSAGIIEAGFPIADRLEEEYDTSQSYVTFHTQSSRENALYVANGGVTADGAKAPAIGQWYRMAQNTAPEQGNAWSTKAQLSGLNMGCVQSVEVTPGVYRLLISGTAAGPIWQRDLTRNTDNGNPYAVQTVVGNIVLALPGQLAALSFITLESVKTGTRAGLALLLGELSGTFEALKRTRQDPPILPPSNTLFSDRYHFAQNQSEAWCRHFQMQLTWPAEDAANELLTFTIFGQTWQEMRSQ